MVDRASGDGADNPVVRSRALPGGDLIAAVLDRRVMMLADRGGASGLVGRRWADVCAQAAATWPGRPSPVPDDGSEPFVVERVVRLDDVPQVAVAASRRGLQNPDLLLIGRRGGRPALQAADAKFSVETARSKQVSPRVVEALLALGQIVRPIIGELPRSPALLPGVFLSPDCLLTAMMLRGRHGIVRTTVSPREVIVVPVPARSFFEPLEGASLMSPLAELDALPVRIDASLLAGLYYFRLARAAMGCWLDQARPLLAFRDQVALDEVAVGAELRARAMTAQSAFDLVVTWDADVEAVRSQRAAVEQVAGLPVPSRELRDWIARAVRPGEEPPSVNQVRRRLGAWYRAQLRERCGPMQPPVENFGAQLQQLGRVAASLNPQLPRETRRIVRALIEQPTEGDG